MNQETTSESVETAGTDGNWNDQPSVTEEANAESVVETVSVEEAQAIFAENPNVACVETHEGRLWREGYFA